MDRIRKPVEGLLGIIDFSRVSSTYYDKGDDMERHTFEFRTISL